ncbi:unnamed protein product [Lathyrus oleraceus]
MDPNHFHYQQAFFNYMQNYQNPNPQNSQISPVPTNPAIFLPSPNNPNMYPISQMNSNSMKLSTQVPPFSTQVPPFSTQVGTEKEERVVVKKRSREQFTREEDILLIQSWLNVSKDPMDRLAQAKEDELELRVVQMMMKDTFTMNDSQRDIHEKYCNKMKKNMECS